MSASDDVTIHTIEVGELEYLILGNDTLKAEQDRLEQSTGDDMNDRHTRSAVACTIADDRRSAGSTAARAAAYILIEHGWDALTAFIEDLEHHESPVH